MYFNTLRVYDGRSLWKLPGAIGRGIILAMPEEVADADNASFYRVARVGDWVRSYSQGIWQVNRVLQDFYEISDRRTTKREKSGRTLVFSKRLLNKSWKRSFSVEVCDITLTRPLE